MSGLIAMACGETARFSEPYDSLMNLDRPEGWEFRQARSISIAANWNYLASYLLASAHRWIFLVNDDHTYPPDTLRRLLAHQVDAVTGVYLERQAPFAPVLYDRVDAAGAQVHYLDAREHGLIPIAACGDGALLLHRRVLEALDPPWWTLGESQRDAVDHDLSFSRRLQRASIRLYCDLDAIIGHLAVIPIAPVRSAGQWQTRLVCSPTNDVIDLPAAQSVLAPV